MARNKGGFYAVRIGRKPGVYTTWDEAKAQVDGFNGARHKKFTTSAEAHQWAAVGAAEPSSRSGSASVSIGIGFGSDVRNSGPQPDSSTQPITSRLANLKRKTTQDTPPESSEPRPKQHRASGSTELPRSSTLDVYCDGSSLGNGSARSRAGYGVYFGAGSPLNESERLVGPVQTNNRAELTAILRSCELVPERSTHLRIHTDSQYSISCIKDWQHKWRRNGWRLSSGANVQNRDLIERVEDAFAARDRRPELVHVRGHVGIAGNEAADELARRGSLKPPKQERPALEP